MAIKYKCPLCDEVYENEWSAIKCRDRCIRYEHSVIVIDTVLDAKTDPTAFIGKCETCHNRGDVGRIFTGCPFSGSNELPDGCDAYVPDTTFGTKIETLWREQQEKKHEHP